MYDGFRDAVKTGSGIGWTDYHIPETHTTVYRIHAMGHEVKKLHFADEADSFHAKYIVVRECERLWTMVIERLGHYWDDVLYAKELRPAVASGVVDD